MKMPSRSSFFSGSSGSSDSMRSHPLSRSSRSPVSLPSGATDSTLGSAYSSSLRSLPSPDSASRSETVACVSHSSSRSVSALMAEMSRSADRPVSLWIVSDRIRGSSCSPFRDSTSQSDRYSRCNSVSDESPRRSGTVQLAANKDSRFSTGGTASACLPRRL